MIPASTLLTPPSTSLHSRRAIMAVFVQVWFKLQQGKPGQVELSPSPIHSSLYPLSSCLCGDFRWRGTTNATHADGASKSIVHDGLCVDEHTVKAKFHHATRLASRSQTSSRPNSITISSSRAGLRPARELDDDLRVHVVCVSQAKFQYSVLLAGRSQTSSRAR